MTFDQLLYLFLSKHCAIDETAFIFSDDPEETEHFIGYLPQYEKPYWIGLCDIENGCAFLTAEELFHAKVFGGKSLQDRWEDIDIFQIGGIDIEVWMELYGECIKDI